MPTCGSPPGGDPILPGWGWFLLLHYWHPPSLFYLASRHHIDLETFLFCFSIGGVAAVGCHVITGQLLVVRIRGASDDQRLAWHSACVLAPIPAFGAVLLITGDLIWAGLAGFLAGFVGRLLCRRDLAVKSIVGGVLFFVYYVVFLFLLMGMAPGYLNVAWNADGPARVRVLGLPVTELLFGLCFGLYWSGLFEQLAWLFLVEAARRH